jgi:hypothetical protein
MIFSNFLYTILQKINSIFFIKYFIQDKRIVNARTATLFYGLELNFLRRKWNLERRMRRN